MSEQNTATTDTANVAAEIKAAAASSRKLDKVKDAARDLFINGKQLRKHLTLGETCDDYVRESVENGGDRAAAVGRCYDALVELGVVEQDLRVNDWIAVYNLALLATGADCLTKPSGDNTAKVIPDAWIKRHSYRTLLTLKVSIAREGVAWGWKHDRWATNVATWLGEKTSLIGKKLEDAVDSLSEEIKADEERSKRAGMSPERVAQLDRKRAADKRESARKSVATAADGMFKKADEADMNSDDLLFLLVQRGILSPMQTTPMGPSEYANLLTTDTAVELANALVKRGNYEVIHAMTAILRGWLLVNPAPNTVEPLAISA